MYMAFTNLVMLNYDQLFLRIARIIFNSNSKLEQNQSTLCFMVAAVLPKSKLGRPFHTAPLR